MKPPNSEQLSFFKDSLTSNSYQEICQSISNKSKLSPDEFGQAIATWAKKNLKVDINAVALFSGAGGLDIGFCDVGFKLTESVELEEKFAATMRENQSNGNYFSGAEIKSLDVREYQPTLSKTIDFIIGGPPCQSFSAAGRRAAGVAGTNDDRGSLFEEYVRILQKLQPRGFLFENVYGLLGAEKGSSIKKIVTAFREIGYNVSYRILDAADYGVPQHRERLILVGSKGQKFRFPKPTHGPDSLDRKLFVAKEALAGLNIEDRSPSLNGRFGHLLQEVPVGLNYSFFTEKMGHPNPIFAWRSKFSDFLYKADPDVPIRTLKASGGQYTGPFHWDNRHFTIDELKRLQTFPDNYKILGNRSLAAKQIGNSVPPQFSRMLALSVLEQFFAVKLPFKLEYLEENEELTFRKRKSQKTKHYFEKAFEAIDGNSEIKKNTIVPSTFRPTMSENFALSIYDADAKIEVTFTPSKYKWFFNLQKKEPREQLYSLKLTKTDYSPFFREVKEIELTSESDDLKDYTILWKIFEKVLASYNLKADLVQLNGYYQYPSLINYDFVSRADLDGSAWKIIRRLFEGRTVGKIISVKDLEFEFEMNSTDILKGLHFLKNIGYEIRSSNTNSEIPSNHYLIPYKFPTLTPLSVQLKKKI